MTEDILHRIRRSTSNPELLITPEMHNESLIIIEDMCLSIANKALAQLGMTSLERSMHDILNRDLQR